MVVLQAENRPLMIGQKYSYTNTNYLSARTTALVVNSNGFSTNDYVILGNFGSETSEIMQISGVNTTTHELSFTAATKFAHPESTKVTILQYNQVSYYHTAAAAFSATENPLANIDIQADDTATKYYDTVNSSGFGWFGFFNSTTSKITGPSNAIPYANFSLGSVKRIIDNFLSQLNNDERKLVSNAETMLWMNEAFAIAKNELNLVNQEYNASDTTVLSVVSGTSEYALPADFSNMISIYNGTDQTPIPFISLEDVAAYDAYTTNTMRYYLRGAYIGFAPEPTGSLTINYRYGTKSTELNSYYDTVDLPDNSFYLLKDYMMFRAAVKLGRPNPTLYLDMFDQGIARMKTTSIKRNNNPNSFGQDPTSIV